MDRERQIELMKSAEVRTEGYLRTWIQNPRFKAALHRDHRKNSDGKQDPNHQQKRCVGR
jgi:fatty-acid desaturase